MFEGAVHGQLPQLSGDCSGFVDAQPGFGSSSQAYASLSTLLN